MFGIYDGDNSGGTGGGFIPRARPQIEGVFERFYADGGEPSQDSQFSGRSDYRPFITVGIPAGGLFTGAEVPKTAAEAALYSGVAEFGADPFYHLDLRQLSAATGRTWRCTTCYVRTTSWSATSTSTVGRELRRDRDVLSHVRLRHVDRERRGPTSRARSCSGWPPL